ncbi:MAG: hypothetical protein ACT4P1_16745 [Sporichthyaceae bacterium]
MSTSETPDAYEAALDRLLDGLEADPSVGGEGAAAQAEAASDVAALSKALSLIGDALAAESAPAAVAPIAAGGATVVPIAGRRPWMNPRILAAAATLAFAFGFGIPVALSVGGGSGDESSISAGGSLSDTAESAQNRARLRDEAAAGETTADTAAEAPAAAGAIQPPPPVPLVTAGKAEAGAADAPAAPAPESDGFSAPSAPQEAAPAKQAKRFDGFADSVGCARAIMIGTVTAITPTREPSQVQLTIAVTEWISPAAGAPVVSYVVTGPVAITSKGEEKLQIGDRRLFVIPGADTDVVRTFRQPEWEGARERIATAQAEQAGADCS